jgi:PAS domain S-box-containing protein
MTGLENFHWLALAILPLLIVFCWFSYRRQRAAEALATQLELYHRIFEQAPAPVTLLDSANGRIMEVNACALALSGFPREALIGRTILEWPHLPDGSKQLVQANLQRRLRGEAVPPYELEFLTPDQRRLVGCVFAVPLVDRHGKLLADLVLISDITARKVAEERLQKTLQETERYNRLMVGREVRVVELKQEVNTLARELGREPPYRVGTTSSGDREQEAQP